MTVGGAGGARTERQRACDLGLLVLRAQVEVDRVGNGRGVAGLDEQGGPVAGEQHVVAVVRGDAVVEQVAPELAVAWGSLLFSAVLGIEIMVATPRVRAVRLGPWPLPRTSSGDRRDGLDLDQLVVVAEDGDPEEGAGRVVRCHGVPVALPRRP